jgi:hypothetical protein
MHQRTEEWRLKAPPRNDATCTKCPFSLWRFGVTRNQLPLLCAWGEIIFVGLELAEVMGPSSSIQNFTCAMVLVVK